MTRIFHRGWIQIVFTRLQHLGWLGLACPSMKPCSLHIYHNLDMYIFRRPKQSGPELERGGTAVIQLQMQFELWQRKRQSNLVHLQFRLSQIIITFQSIKKLRHLSQVVWPIDITFIVYFLRLTHPVVMIEEYLLCWCQCWGGEAAAMRCCWWMGAVQESLIVCNLDDNCGTAPEIGH